MPTEMVTVLVAPTTHQLHIPIAPWQSYAGVEETASELPVAETVQLGRQPWTFHSCEHHPLLAIVRASHAN